MIEMFETPGFFYKPGKKKEKINYIQRNYCKLSAMERDKIMKEDCILEAYQDTEGVWTIGVGQTGFNVYEGLEISLDMAIMTLQENMRRAEDDARILFEVKELTGMGVVRYNVVLDLLFNMGLPRLSKFKDFIKYTKEGNYMLAGLNLLYKAPLKNSSQTKYWTQVKDRALNNAEKFIRG